MKYLKKFNEKLSSGVYSRASRKLTKLGHTKRANALKDYSKIVSNRESLIKWEENIAAFSKYGKVKLKLTKSNDKEGDFFMDEKLSTKGEKDVFALPEISEYFYLQIIPDIDSMIDSYSDEIGTDNFTEFNIQFSVGAIPVDKESLDKVLSFFDQNSLKGEFDNGFIWAFFVSINFEIESGKMKFKELDIHTYDSSQTGNISIADRPSANRLKTMLKSMFTEKSDYPSGYTDITDAYEKMEKAIIQDLSMYSDYGLTMEKIHGLINSVNVNTLFKD